MNAYNVAFFGLYENFYTVMSEEIGHEKALDLFTKIMKKGLKKSYDSYGFNKGDPVSFASVIKERDNFVGLEVSFPEVGEKKIIYQFHKDPFPNLKGLLDPYLLDKTYLDFKVKYLLGDSWKYVTTKHLWLGDKYSEHIITLI